MCWLRLDLRPCHCPPFCLGLLVLMLAATWMSSDAEEIDTQLASASVSPEDTDQILLLAVEINGHALGKIGEFTLRQGQLMARPEQLCALGFRILTPAEGVSLLRLSDIPGLTWSLDTAAQVLRVRVDEQQLVPTLLWPSGDAQEQRRVESGNGMTLNFDVVNSLTNSRNIATASWDLRMFTAAGIASSGWITRMGQTSSTGAERSVRLDSFYTFADVEKMRHYTVGDFIAGNLSWTRPVRLAGVQIRSDFSTRPDLVTFPLPSLKGSAAVPSTVSVLADNSLIFSSQVPSGPFEIPDLPVLAGAGTISMTVSNAAGQQVRIVQPFYASSSLLAPGLHTYTLQAGWVRRNWGSRSNDYSNPAATIMLRRGLTSRLTAEGSLECTRGTAVLGGGGIVQIGTIGELSMAAASSLGSRSAGVQVALSAQRIGRIVSIGSSALLSSPGYRDIASASGDAIAREQLSGFASVSLRRVGSAGLAFAGQTRTDASSQPGGSATLRSRVLSATYSVPLGRFSIYATEYKSFTGSGESGLQVGLSLALGKRTSAEVSGVANGVQTRVQRSAIQVGDWGYDAYVSSGKSSHQFVQAAYKSPIGLFTAGLDSGPGQHTIRLESAGAVSFVDRRLFASNTIYDSFAIVDTRPSKHVRVFQENRSIGTTGSTGRLLVPDMRSFDVNRLAIDTTDLPDDATIGIPHREVRPQERSGIVVNFPIESNHGALLRLVDDNGVAIPLGSTATLKNLGSSVPVGYDGEVYVEHLTSHNELLVMRSDGRHCTAVFPYSAQPGGEIPFIAPLRCTEQQP